MLNFSRYIDHRTGTRSYAAYIYDKAGNDNLVILTRKRVNRIVFKNGVATGVECVDEQDPAVEVALFEARCLVSWNIRLANYPGEVSGNLKGTMIDSASCHPIYQA